MYSKLNPTCHTDLKVVEAPLVAASADNLKGYGWLVDDYEDCEIEITRWPAQGWRPVDDDTGDEGGTTEGTFHFDWQGDVLYGHNDAVNDRYLLGWSEYPSEASEKTVNPARERVYLRHANYHPDGGQLFFPKTKSPFVTPLCLPGDDVSPEKFVNFYCDGTQGLYIHAGVWHEAIFPMDEQSSFLDKQGKVHARVSCNFDSEFGTYLSAQLKQPD
jgi:ureidoglycolate lyase